MAVAHVARQLDDAPHARHGRLNLLVARLLVASPARF